MLVLFICVEMRIITSIFLILVVSLVSFQEATFYVLFKINQNYIAQNLCVEKNIKKSKCKGHCQLKKIVEESKDAPSPEMPFPGFEPTKIELFVLANNEIEDIFKESVSETYFGLKIYYDSDFSNSIFHPPIA